MFAKLSRWGTGKGGSREKMKLRVGQNTRSDASWKKERKGRNLIPEENSTRRLRNN